MNCKNCGSIINNGEPFCRNCGKSIESEFDYLDNEQNQAIKTNKTSSFFSFKIIVIFVVLLLVIVYYIYNTVEKYIDIADRMELKPDLFNNNSISNEINTKDSNYIVTETGKKVYFEIASTLKEDKEYSDEDLRLFVKDVDDEELCIWISESYGTMDNNIEEINSTIKYLKSQPGYSNFKLSQSQVKNAYGREFKLINVTYDYESIKINDLYILSELKNRSLYSVEIEESQLLTEDELKGLLDIKIID